MKIYDCIIFFDENFLLDIRFNILDKFVDYFVVVESNRTWQNNLKKFNFDLKRFEKFSHKIIYIKVEDMPGGSNPWVRENFQRNCIERGLFKANNDDLIIISDADEIPNPLKINDFNPKKQYCVLQQKFFYYKLNLLNVTYPNWLGSKICVKKYLKSPQWLRDLKIKKRPFWRIDKIKLKYVISDGGWHFSNLKTPQELLYKYKNLCEFKDDYVFFNSIDEKFLDESIIKYNIDNKLDIIGRSCEYKKINIDNSFPEYIYVNQEKFQNWIEQ
jgi:beta-1,4-mannosyl-glycoprotein beta-1,4-N-acetylglucosaminyltransferase